MIVITSLPPKWDVSELIRPVKDVPCLFVPSVVILAFVLGFMLQHFGFDLLPKLTKNKIRPYRYHLLKTDRAYDERQKQFNDVIKDTKNSQKQRHERFVLFKQMSGNLSIASAIVALSRFFNGELRSGILIFLMAIVLLTAHRHYLRRQDELERITIE